MLPNSASILYRGIFRHLEDSNNSDGEYIESELCVALVAQPLVKAVDKLRVYLELL